MTANHALVLATLLSVDRPVFLSPILTAAATAAQKRLTIILFSQCFNHPTAGGVARLSSWRHVLRLLTYVYVQATHVAQTLEKMLLRVDVLLHGNDQSLSPTICDEVDIVFRVAGDSISVQLPLSVSSARQSLLPAVDSGESEHSVSPLSGSSFPLEGSGTRTKPELLPVVALGGTFDHLHAGHKILLSMAAWVTCRQLIIGLTADKLLRHKKHQALIESFAMRASAVREFVSLFRSGIVCDIAPLYDVCGPTGYERDIDGLVVSHETLSGAESIAKHRAIRGFPELKTLVIDVISADEERLDPEDSEVLRETKMSSTFIREWISRRGTDSV